MSGFSFTNPPSGFPVNQGTVPTSQPQLGFGVSTNVNQTTGFPSSTNASTGFPFSTASSQTFSSSTSPFHGDNRQQTTSIFGASSTVPFSSTASNSAVFGGSNASTTGSTLGTFGFGTSSSLVKPTNLAPSASSSLVSTQMGNASMFSGARSAVNSFSMAPSTLPNNNPVSTFGSVVATTTPFSFGGGGGSLHATGTTPSPMFSSSFANNPPSFQENKFQNSSIFHTSTSPSLMAPPLFGNNPLQPFLNTSSQAFGRAVVDKSSAFTHGIIPGHEIKEEDMMGMSNTQTIDSDFTEMEQQVTQQKEVELARLKAKIEEKRKLLHEKKQRFEASIHTDMDAMNTTNPPSSFQSQVSQPHPFQAPVPRKQLNPQALSFIPTPFRNIDSTEEMEVGDNNIHPGPLVIQSKFKPRFLNHEDGDDVEDDMDPDLKPLTMDQSLTGTCPYMCPEEEWIRRETEGDIQILEMPHAAIHPKGWTLRETAVKRFRRSAADFKLDIPSLVRPPHVLERVCAYLEEWVMERDRQGVDQRYVQMGRGSVPPSLDVYQFIWDRTRMIRKDFILQNFVGTGGRCSATAVRVHERIARWHAMCEHQLSHLPDFIAQSQQNIQELGQTMKTLNLYYDDVLGRCAKEEEDYEFRHHGCMSSTVMGPSPIDYDGSPLINAPEFVQSYQRLIGVKDLSVSATSEAEMRALYILLTANNDGGMEVIKYAGRLSVVRPDIFKSAPVKLAMEIFKAKKEYNYAKFFALLRDPGTPYLFACVMFKYVEQMREVAFRMMSKAFGNRKKETLENTCDLYPLSDLVSLLCFEDQEDAKEACSHYSIIVETMSHVDTIIWKKSEFSKPRDPIKGTILHLRPRKMIRTIERKLHGATRLAVCRGDLSWIDPKEPFIPSEAVSGVCAVNPAQPVRFQDNDQDLCTQLESVSEHNQWKDDKYQRSSAPLLTSDIYTSLTPVPMATTAAAPAFSFGANPAGVTISRAVNSNPANSLDGVKDSIVSKSVGLESSTVSSNIPSTTSAPLFSFASSAQTDPKATDAAASNTSPTTFVATSGVAATSTLSSFHSLSPVPTKLYSSPNTTSDNKNRNAPSMNPSSSGFSSSLVASSSGLVPAPKFTFGSTSGASTVVMDKKDEIDLSMYASRTAESALASTIAFGGTSAIITEKKDENAQSINASASSSNYSLLADAPVAALSVPAPAIIFGNAYASSGAMTDEKDGNTPATKVPTLAVLPSSSSTSGFTFRSAAPSLFSLNKDTALEATPAQSLAIRSPSPEMRSKHVLALGDDNQRRACIEKNQRQHLAAEKMRKQREEAYRKSEDLWIKRISTARKIFVMKKWLRVVDRRHLKRREVTSLQFTSDPTSSRFPLSPLVICDKEQVIVTRRDVDSSKIRSLEELLYCMGTNTSTYIDFDALFQRFKDEIVQSDRTVLCTIGFCVCGDPYLSELMKLWIESRVKSPYSQDIYSSCRTAVVDCTDYIDSIDKCDAALLIIPPRKYGQSADPSSTIQMFSNAQIPRVILNFDDGESYDDNDIVKDLSALQGCNEIRVGSSIFNECHLDSALLQCFEFLTEELARRLTPGRSIRFIEKIPLGIFVCQLLRKIVWLCSLYDDSESIHLSHVQRSLYNEREEQIFNNMKSAIRLLLNELETLHSSLTSGIFHSWPFEEFLNEKQCVPYYFRDRSGLPSSWLQSLNRTKIESSLRDHLPSMFHASSSLFTFLDDSLGKSPESLKQECVIFLQRGRVYDACQRTLEFLESVNSSWSTIYLPIGEISNSIDSVCSRLFPSLASLPVANISQGATSEDSYDADKEASFNDTTAPLSIQPSETHSVLLPMAADQVISPRDTTAPPSIQPSEIHSVILPITETNNVLADPVISPVVTKGVSTLSKKRHRTSTEPTASTDEVGASKAFTAKLKSLLNEEALFDMKIGNTYLSNILH